MSMGGVILEKVGLRVIGGVILEMQFGSIGGMILETGSQVYWSCDYRDRISCLLEV